MDMLRSNSERIPQAIIAFTSNQLDEIFNDPSLVSRRCVVSTLLTDIAGNEIVCCGPG